MRRTNSPRRGVVMLATCVCALVAVSLLVAGVSRAVLRHQQLRTWRDARQADLLLAAGQDLALAALRANAEYRGQRWEPTVTDRDSAVVLIESDVKTRRLTVSVVYPRDSRRPVRRSATFPIPNPLLEGS